jgi:hypothetical protein
LKRQARLCVKLRADAVGAVLQAEDFGVGDMRRPSAETINLAVLSCLGPSVIAGEGGAC